MSGTIVTVCESHTYLHKEFHCLNISLWNSKLPQCHQAVFNHSFDMNRFKIAQCYPTHFPVVRTVTFRCIQQRHGCCLKKNYFHYRSSPKVVSELKFVYKLSACASPTTFRILINVMLKHRDKLHLYIYEMVKFRTQAIYTHIHTHTHTHTRGRIKK